MPLWLIITGLGITQIIGWGTVFFMIGTLSPDIAATTGWPDTLIFGAFTGALLVGAAVARPAGRLIDSRGGRLLVPFGSLLLGAGCAITGFFPTKFGYVAGWLTIGAGMRLATYDAVFAALTQISREKARRSISALTLMGGLSSTVFWPLNHYLAKHVGWQDTFLIHAALNVFLCLPLHLLILGEARPIPADIAGSDTGDALTGPARAVAIALFATALSINSFLFSALSAHILPLFNGIGLTPAEVVLVSSIIGPAQVTSRLAEMMLGRRLGATRLGAWSFGLVPAAFAVLFAGGLSFAAALGFALVYGASNGVVTITRGVVPLALFGRRGYAEVLGLIGMPSLILSAIAPLVFAWVLKITSAPTSFVLLALCAVASALAMLALHRLYPR